MKVLQWRDLDVAQSLGKGGQGVVSVLRQSPMPDHPEALCVKRYHDAVITKYGQAQFATISALVRRHEELPTMARRILAHRTLWPVALVADGERHVGFLMPVLTQDYFFDMPLTRGGTKETPRELQHYMRDPKHNQANGLTRYGASDRWVLLTLVAQTMADLHHLNIVVGDVQGANIVENMVTAQPKRTFSIRICDNDSFRLAGTASAIPQPNAPSWHAPETLSAQASGGPGAPVLTVKTDVYKFGLLAARLMPMRSGVSSLRDFTPSQETWQKILGPRRLGVLTRTLATSPSQRPSMAEVFEALSNLRYVDLTARAAKASATPR